MDDIHEALSSVRRDLRRVEDEQAQMNRKKAANEDVEVLAKKQSEMESEHRSKLQTIQSEMHALNQNLKRLADGIEAIGDELLKHKRKTANELEALAEGPTAPTEKRKGGKSEDGTSKPFVPMQLQITLYVLAGIGLMALIQNAPAAMQTLPRFGLGG